MVSHSGYPWQKEVCAPVSRVLDLSGGFVQEPTTQFRFHETSQSPPFENFVSTTIMSPATFSNGHIAIDRCRTNFFRDLDGEALPAPVTPAPAPTFGHGILLESHCP
ncbi:hypothetical protein MTO96_031161 [Rhipicephalus appendiculatus]